MSAAVASRLPGLDLLRALAIGLVLLSHYQGFVSHNETFGALGAAGWAGVDLFFVLSGYLIGNQILAPLAAGQGLSLRVFFARRLLRTLPNYYVVLAVYLLALQFAPHSPILGKSMAPAWSYLTFTQNFGLAYGQTFTHSWSLCIEEQFYVVMPLAALLLARYARAAWPAWLVLGLAVAAGVAARTYAWLAHDLAAFDAEVYYSSFCRSDELLFGVAIALLRNFHPAAFQRLMGYGNALLGLGLLLSVAVLSCIVQHWTSPFVTSALGFSLVAASFAVLVCAVLSPTCILHRWRVPGAASLALWSYAVYLAHKPIFMALSPWCKTWRIDPESPLCIAAVMALGILGGWILFRGVETPFMRLRARWYPASMAAGGRRG